MNRWTVLLAATLTCVVVAMGCSGGGNPVAPNDLTSGQAAGMQKTQTHLWGYYDVYIDIPAQTATALFNRNAMFTANVVQFVNGDPANLQFTIHGTPVGTSWVDVDIDVAIRHPFKGMSAYNGYDVRGVFIGNASGVMKYNSDLKYARYGKSDQVVYDYDAGGYADPYTGLAGMPDGYTRWFNPGEFQIPGIVGYTPGLFATPGYKGSATLNPYKYFADGLSVAGDVWSFLNSTTGHGKFASGNTNKRNYYIRFPNAAGIRFGYAIIANWINETTHPANGNEAMAVRTTVTPNIYYASSTDKGGNLILDIDVFSWKAQPSAIRIESTVLSDAYKLSPSEMVPTGGTSTYSTYHVEIPADNITGTTGQEYWVIAETNGSNYTNPFGIYNSAGNDVLAAFFRHDLYVAPTPYNEPPVCDLVSVDPMPYAGLGDVTFDASGSSDPDPGDTITYSWDFNGDGTFGDTYDSGTPDKPTKKFTSDYVGKVWVKVTDTEGEFDSCSIDVNINVVLEIKVTGTPNMPIGVTAAKDISVASDYQFIIYDITASTSGIRRWANYTYSGTPGEKTFSFLFQRVAIFSYNIGMVSSLYSGSYYSRYYGALSSLDFWGPWYWLGTNCYGFKDMCIDMSSGYTFAVYDAGPLFTNRADIIYQTDYNVFNTFMTINAPWVNGSGTSGVIMANLKAVAMHHNISFVKYMYFLETLSPTTAVVERYSIFSNPPEFSLKYGDSTPFQLRAPLDITADFFDNVYVLDILASGRPIIYVWDSSGNPIGTTGEISVANCAGTPKAIDAATSPTPDEIHLLQNNAVTRFACPQ